MRMLRIIIILGCVLFPAFAHAQFVVEQSRVESVVQPGKSLVDRIVLHNTANNSKNVRIYWQDFEYVAPFDGEKSFMPAGSLSHSLSNWTTLSRDYATIPAGESITVNYSIKVPADADGGYYGVLFFEEDDPSQVTSTGVKIVMRVGTLFFLGTNDNRDHADVQNLILKDGKFSGQIINHGNTILFPEGTYYALDQDGWVADRGELKKRYLPAGQSATFEWSLPDTLPVSEYTTILTFDLGYGYSLVREIDFSKKSNGDVVITQIRN